MNDHRLLRKTGLIVLLCALLVMMSACKEAPNASRSPADEIASEPIVSKKANSNEIDNSHLETLPSVLKEEIKKGKFTVSVDAQIVMPSTQKIYQWDSMNWDLSSDEAQENYAKILLGEKYNSPSDRIGGYFETNEALLIIEPEKQTFIYEVNNTGEKDLTAENFIGTEGLDGEYIKEVKSHLEKLALMDFEPVLCEKYGNITENKFYSIWLERKMEGIYVISDLSFRQEMGLETMPYDSIHAIVTEEGTLAALNIRCSKVDEHSKKEVAVIPLSRAMEVFKEQGIAIFSAELAQGRQLTVDKIALAYTHVPAGESFQLVPIWLFSMHSQSQEDGEEVGRKVQFAINAVTEEIV